MAILNKANFLSKFNALFADNTTGDISEADLRTFVTDIQDSFFNIPDGAVGEVLKTGTPLNNQLAVWTDATTVEGDANLTWTGATFGVTGAVDITGDLDVDNININGNTIISTDVNGNITLTPNGIGNVAIGTLAINADQTVGAGQDNYVLTFDNGTGLVNLEVIPTQGNVSNTGTPLNNQLAVWTNANTLEGNSTFTFDGSEVLIDIDNSSVAIFRLQAKTSSLHSSTLKAAIFRATDTMLGSIVAGFGVSTEWQIPSTSGTISNSFQIATTWSTINTTKKTELRHATAGPMIRLYDGGGASDQLEFHANHTSGTFEMAILPNHVHMDVGAVTIGSTSAIDGEQLTVYGSSNHRLALRSSSATGSPFMTFYQTTTRRAYIEYNESTTALRLSVDKAAGVIVFFTQDTLRATIEANGNFTLTGAGTGTNWTATSDARLKSNIITPTSNDVMNKITDIGSSLRHYYHQQTKQNEYGFIAQELNLIAPEYVTVPEDNEAYWSVNYSKMAALAIKGLSIHELRIQELENEVSVLKIKLNGISS